MPTFIIQISTSDLTHSQDNPATVSENRLTPNAQQIEFGRSTTADVTGDGTPDLIVGAGPGGGFYDRVIEGSSTRAAGDESQDQFVIQMGTSDLNNSSPQAADDVIVDSFRIITAPSR